MELKKSKREIVFEKLNKIKLAIFKYTGLSWLNQKYKKIPNVHRQKIVGLLFVLPWLIGLYLFGLRPFLSSLRMTVADKAQYIIVGEKVEFIVKGWTFRHFLEFFQNQPNHVTLTTNVFLDIMLIVPLVLVFSLVLALMLNQKIKGRGVFRVIFFIPVILLSGNMLSYFTQYNLLSVPAIQSGKIIATIERFLPRQFLGIIIGAFEKIVLILWLSGVQTLIFLAGLQKQNPAIYEAAAIDGASMWESFWKITLPNLFNLMVINIIYTTVIYANLSNNSLIQLINQTLTDVRFGRSYSSMLAWVLFAIELIVIGFYILVIKITGRKYQ